MPTRKKAKEEIDYLHKKYYGEIPPYLTKLKQKVKEEYVSIREMQRRNEEEDAKRKKVLSEDEIRTLREGLLKKLEQLKYSYGQITHKKKYDTLVLLKKKEGLEKEMATIEKDLQLLNNRNVIVDLTK
jgi:membrane-associated HD superfamily phosphohydrolase